MVCATDDGVVLQLTPDGRPTPLFEVETLDYAPQNPRWFLPPPEYQIAVLPGIGGIAKLQPAPAPRRLWTAAALIPEPVTRAGPR